MLKTLLASFIALTCTVSYADLNNQSNQNSNSTDSSSTLVALPASGAVQFEQPWARPTTNVDNQISNSAMYFTLVNTREASYNLTNISSDEIGKIEIHQTITDEKGNSKMVKVDYPFLISGNINAEFKPGGMHIMLYDLKRDLNVGDSFDLTFFFDDGTTKTVNVKVATDNPYNKTGS
ncbi:MAG TPA: copper chaperone PCu(A)C [Rickettsia endosymbiont of Pyrocoelia pectoralis]|nr:copper chaperone PCu(A)C [Rickettsia endosymbiont of Pyrocoelia pectoralis]